MSRPTASRCFISGCENEVSVRKHCPGEIHYFRPTTHHRRFSQETAQQWARVIPPREGRLGVTEYFDIDNEKHVICELHFEEECLIKADKYVVNGKTDIVPRWKWLLVPNTIPTKFLNNSLEGRGGSPPSKKIKSEDQEEMEEALTPPPITSTFLPPPEGVYDRYKKDFYCSICLESFTGDLEFLKSAKSREATYLQFVSLVGKYLGEDFQSAQRALLRESHQERLFASVYRSVCDGCLDSLTRFCRLFGELELIRMKLNSEIQVISQIFDKDDWEGKKCGLENRVDKDKMNPVIQINQAIKSKTMVFLNPQVILKPSKDSEGSIPSAPTEEIDDLIECPEGSSLPQTPAGTDLICGSSSFANILGLGSIQICLACDKYFRSNAELQNHKQVHHSNRAWKPSSSSNPLRNQPSTETVTDTPSQVLNDDRDDGYMMSPCPNPASFEGDPTGDTAGIELATEALPIPPPHPPPSSGAAEPLVEPKQEVEEPPTPSTAKMVPFMSSEYIGKYKIVCKLMNVKTGKTCMGVLAKTPKPATVTSSSVPPSDTLPRVISTQSEPVTQKTSVKQEVVKSTPGPPPYKCPVEGCTIQFKFKCRYTDHYRRHKLLLETQALKRLKISNRNQKAKISRTRKRQGPPPRDYPCEVKGCRCRGGFCRKEDLEYHQKLKHVPVQCQFCSRELPSIVQLINHEITEHQAQQEPAADNQPSNQSCPRCHENVFTVSHGLRNHYASVHFQISPPKPSDLDRSFFCTDCNRQFSQLNKFTRHILQFHQDDQSILDRELSHKCTSCERRFRFESHLRQHQKRFHEKGPRSLRQLPVFHCNICGKVYLRNRFRYESHMKLHAKDASWDWNSKTGCRTTTGSVPPAFTCEFCGKLFQKEGTLWLHRRRVHDKSVQCGECGKSFSTKGYLAFHMRTTHQPKSNAPKTLKPKRGPVACQICSKRLPGRGLLRYHMRRVHPEISSQFEVDPERGCVCDQCGKVYEDKGSLQRHMRRWCPGRKQLKTDDDKPVDHI